jgi:multicomponent Na+:H+ antiporter subunit C
MSLALILAVGGLTSVGLYLITARSLSRIVLGFALLGHAAVVALIAAGGPAGEAPIAGTAASADLANPLPQALALTAIVISFGLTLFLLALARRQQELTGDDLVEDDIEDQRIAAASAAELAEDLDDIDESVDDAIDWVREQLTGETASERREQS